MSRGKISALLVYLSTFFCLLLYTAGCCCCREENALIVSHVKIDNDGCRCAMCVTLFSFPSFLSGFPNKVAILTIECVRSSNTAYIYLFLYEPTFFYVL